MIRNNCGERRINSVASIHEANSTKGGLKEEIDVLRGSPRFIFVFLGKAAFHAPDGELFGGHSTTGVYQR